jgi:hypothetical protein
MNYQEALLKKILANLILYRSLLVYLMRRFPVNLDKFLSKSQKKLQYFPQADH